MVKSFRDTEADREGPVGAPVPARDLAGSERCRGWTGGRGAALAFFAWSFFFLPPYHTLSVQDPKDWLSLAVFLMVGVIVGIMAGRMREREARARAREHEAATLNRLSAELVSHTSTATMAQVVAREAVDQLGARSATLFLANEGALQAYCSWPAYVVPSAAATEQAERAYARVRGRGLEEGEAGPVGLALPLQSSSTNLGVLSVRPTASGRAFSGAEVRLATSLAYLVSAFLERQELQAKATQAEAGREADRLKSSLLSSVSHELKTPLAALTATVSNLLESDVQWDEESVRDELRSIVSDVTRLNGSISALLELSRLEARTWELRTWCTAPILILSVHSAEADALVAATAGDNTNAVTARVAKEVYRVPDVISRIYDPQRAEIYRRYGVQTFAPTAWSASKIIELITSADLEREQTFGNGEIQMLAAWVPEHFVGKPVNDLRVPGEIRVALIVRMGRGFLPVSGTTFEKDDQVHVLVHTSAVDKFQKTMGWK